MLIENDQPGGVTVLKIGGSVKIGETVREFEQSLERVAEERTGAVVLDLTDLEYMDSTVVGVLVGALHRLKAQGRELVLEIYDTVPEALGTIKNKEQDTDVR